MSADASESTTRINTIREEILSRIARVHALPTLPFVVGQVMHSMREPLASATHVAHLLQHDQSLTARLLRLANSAFYAPLEPVRSVDHAVVLVGFSTVNAVLVKASLFDAYDQAHAKPLWLHALGTACAARAIARHTNMGRLDEAFIMGLLHDIGKLALMHEFPAYARTTREHANDHRLPIAKAEQAILGCDHTDIGRVLAERWGLPPEYLTAIACHHRVFEAAEEHRRWAACVHVADILARSLLIGHGGDPIVPVIDRRALALLHLTHDDFGSLFALSEEELGLAEVFFHVLEEDAV